MIPAPDRLLRFDPDALGLKAAPRAFFRRETITVAKDLVGAWFARRWRGVWYGGRIVETEAYLGEKDAAAHSRNGRRTPRVEPMYGDGGTLYVFFVYGMHYCANVVTRRSGDPQAVLLRAAEGPEGAPSRLLSGPARLCAALGERPGSRPRRPFSNLSRRGSAPGDRRLAQDRGGLRRRSGRLAAAVLRPRLSRGLEEKV